MAEVVERQVRFGTAELIPDPFRQGGWTVAVDGVAQSYVDVTDPTHLGIRYESWIGLVVDRHWPARPLTAVHVGGAGCTIPRYVAATRPGSTQTVFELDGDLVDFVRSHLGLDVPGLDVRIGDGRAGVASLGDGCADLVVLDVFRGGEFVLEMATVDFVRDAARVLATGGVFVANVWDGEGLEFARRFMATVMKVHPHALIIGEAGVFLGSRAGNLVVAASASPLPLTELVGAGKDLGNAFFCLTGGQFATFSGKAEPITKATEHIATPPVRKWHQGSRF